MHGYPTPNVGIWMHEVDIKDYGNITCINIYEPDFYKTHADLEGELQNARVDYDLSPDRRNQTVFATVYLPYDMVQYKIFMCYADNGLSYPEIQTIYMQFEATGIEIIGS